MSACTCECHAATPPGVTDEDISIVDDFLDHTIESHPNGALRLAELREPYESFCGDEDTAPLPSRKATAVFRQLLGPTVRRGPGTVFPGYRMVEVEP